MQERTVQRANVKSPRHMTEPVLVYNVQTFHTERIVMSTAHLLKLKLLLVTSRRKINDFHAACNVSVSHFTTNVTSIPAPHFLKPHYYTKCQEPMQSRSHFRSLQDRHVGIIHGNKVKGIYVVLHWCETLYLKRQSGGKNRSRKYENRMAVSLDTSLNNEEHTQTVWNNSAPYLKTFRSHCNSASRPPSRPPIFIHFFHVA